MNLLDSTFAGLNMIFSAMEPCPFCGKKKLRLNAVECPTAKT